MLADDGARVLDVTSGPSGRPGADEALGARPPGRAEGGAHSQEAGSSASYPSAVKR
jgi:hypothetical protein